MIEVFPTSRCIREFYKTFLDTNQLAPKAMNIAEFESKCIYIPNKALADEDTRVLLMQEAASFENFKALKIPREFLSFLKNSSYIFRFFEELANEKTSIDALRSADTYAEFDEYLDVLENLLQNYTALLEQNSLYDKITQAKNYELNSDFLLSHEGFLIHLEGFLNNFELELFEKIASLVPLKISLHVNKFNKKMCTLLGSFGFFLEVGFEYILNLSTRQIEKQTKISYKNYEAEVYSFSSRALQCAFVQEKISQFVTQGIEPENIVVILPDESFASMLKEFDVFRNLNFAMGEGFTRALIYQRLEALDKAIKDDEVEHTYRINRLGIEKSVLQLWKSKYRAKLDASEIIELFENLKPKEIKEDESIIFNEELFKFARLLERLGTMELQKALRLFLNRLKERSLDDVKGGKVTVMGLLESRGMSFKGVIVADFTDEFVPKRSKKDIFLSSKVREHAKLPSKKDRENLQRYFYTRAFEGAKKVAISYTQNEQSMASRFLDELGFQKSGEVDERSYARALFEYEKQKPRFDPQSLEGSYDLKAYPLSASKLKTLLTCKRAFYYKYILKSAEAKIPDDEISEADVGNMLHEALRFVLENTKEINADVLMIELRRYLLTQRQDVKWLFHFDIWLERLKSLCENEAKRFEEGFRVYSLETKYKINYKGFELEGYIDRIDTKDNSLSVIDYKSGKIPQTTSKTLEKAVDFQLEFYHLLASDKGEVEGVYYYDLKKGELFAEELLEEKLSLLESILEDLSEPISGFEKCESTQPCTYCPYVKLCGREE